MNSIHVRDFGYSILYSAPYDFDVSYYGSKIFDYLYFFHEKFNSNIIRKLFCALGLRWGSIHVQLLLILYMYCPFKLPCRWTFFKFSVLNKQEYCILGRVHIEFWLGKGEFQTVLWGRVLKKNGGGGLHPIRNTGSWHVKVLDKRCHFWHFLDIQQVNPVWS